jgi:hypothetical protein
MHPNITKAISWPVLVAALAATTAASSGLVAILGTAHLAAIALGEATAIVALAALTVLIWAAVQDGTTAR